MACPSCMLVFALFRQWLICFRLAIVPAFQRHLPGLNVYCKFGDCSLKPAGCWTPSCQPDLLFCRSDRQHRGKGKRSKGRAQSEGNPKYMLVMRNLNKKQYRRKDFLPCHALPCPALPCLALALAYLPCLCPALPCPVLPALLWPALLISSPNECPEHRLWACQADHTLAKAMAVSHISMTCLSLLMTSFRCMASSRH